MRNEDRIPEVLNALEDEWRDHPDLRLGQLLWKIADGDPFGLEDDELMTRLGEDLSVDYFEESDRDSDDPFADDWYARNPDWADDLPDISVDPFFDEGPLFASDDPTDEDDIDDTVYDVEQGKSNGDNEETGENNG